ncbi:MAG: hypothetical protein JO253_04200, partial [Alphaproteobacteria bacterium]|nr:hypothetical protein [Alphaproteobacteria bacterium]
MNLALWRTQLERWLVPGLLAVSVVVLLVGVFGPFARMNLWLIWQVGQVATIGFTAVALCGLYYLGTGKLSQPVLWGLAGVTGFGLLALLLGWLPVVAALLVFLCCFSVGQITFYLTRCTQPALLDGLCVGIGVTILILTAGSIAHINMPLLYRVLLIVPALLVLLAPALQTGWMGAGPLATTPHNTAPFVYADFILGVMIVGGFLFYAASSALPEVSWDGQVMHLLVPNQILMRGHWSFDQTLYSFAPWPLGADYLFGMAMLVGGEAAAKCFNLLTFFILVAQLYGFVNRRYGAQAALMAAALLVSMPLALVVTFSLFVENMLALLTLTAMRLLAGADEQEPRTALVSLAILLGALAAVKMHGAFLDAFFLPALALTPFWKKASAKTWRMVAVVAVVAAFLGLLTYLYAWVKTGNPIFMFKNSFFRSPYWAPTDWLDTRWMGKLSWSLLYGMTFRSQDYTEALPGTIGFGFIALLLPGLAALLIRPDRRDRGMLIVTAGFLTFMLSQTQYIRYLYAAVPALIFISVAGVCRVQEIPRLRLPAILLVIALAGFGCYKWPAGSWIVRNNNFAGIWNAEIRAQNMLSISPERVANDVINASGVHDPRVIYGTQPFGGSLNGAPLYTDWYNYTLH